jgi:hypothetical protein
MKIIFSFYRSFNTYLFFAKGLQKKTTINIGGTTINATKTDPKFITEN